MDALEREPREPVLLNAVGVLLFELTEHAGAEAMFKAALRLDPEMPHTAANLESLRKRDVRRRRARAGPRRRRTGCWASAPSRSPAGPSRCRG